MGLKDDLRSKTGEFFSSTVEMFDRIFRHATREFRIKRKPKPEAQGPRPSHAPVKLRHWGERPNPEKPHEWTASPAWPAVTRGTNPPARAKTRKAKSKGSRVLRTGLLLVLLLVLAGFLANHLALIDLNDITDLLGLGPKQVVQVPIPKKQPAKPPEQPVTPPKPPQTAAKAAKPSPTPNVPTPPAMSAEEKLVALETPTTSILQSEPGKKPTGEKAPSLAAQAYPKPPEDAAAQKIRPAPVQTQATVKPAAPEVVAPSEPATPQYPYSVYLGSFKAPEAVRKALSDYQEKGLSAYWARVDLGEKGVWFRFFTGYFRTKEEAEEFIGERNIQGATPGLTKYANLIGSSSSEKEVEDQKKVLVSAGFYPYVIKEAKGRILLYSGAFDRRDFAEKEKSALASKGIKSDVVDR
jgi:hypothetical protein